MNNLPDISEIKNTLNNILEAAKSISPETIAKEILSWTADNVVYFIDNKAKRFKLDLIVDESKIDIFPETKKLQDLYRSLPDEKQMFGTDHDPDSDWTNKLSPEEEEILQLIGDCMTGLDKTTELAFIEMNKAEDLLEKVYKKMAYFYEVKGFKDGAFLLQDMNGAVKVLRFDYEAFSVPVVVTKTNTKKNEDGTISADTKEIINTFVIPEGFSLWIEISVNARQPSLF